MTPEKYLLDLDLSTPGMHIIAGPAGTGKTLILETVADLLATYGNQVVYVAGEELRTAAPKSINEVVVKLDTWNNDILSLMSTAHALRPEAKVIVIDGDGVRLGRYGQIGQVQVTAQNLGISVVFSFNTWTDFRTLGLPATLLYTYKVAQNVILLGREDRILKLKLVATTEADNEKKIEEECTYKVEDLWHHTLRPITA